MVDKNIFELHKEQITAKTDHTVQELATILEKPRVTVQSWVNRGLFPNAFKRSNLWIIPTTDIFTDNELVFEPPQQGRRVVPPTGIPDELLQKFLGTGYNKQKNKEIYEAMESGIDTTELEEKYKLTRQRLHQIHDDYKSRIERAKVAIQTKKTGETNQKEQEEI